MTGESNNKAQKEQSKTGQKVKKYRQTNQNPKSLTINSITVSSMTDKCTTD
uniref:Uncharacterized protein n=1 Tax=Anguilla anguilla TaxID=7936 RepID=A0A0E9RKQ7_ANGAN